MEIDEIKEGCFTVTFYPPTAMLVGEACTSIADNSEHLEFMLALGSALQAAAMAARVAAGEDALSLLREQLPKEIARVSSRPQ